MASAWDIHSRNLGRVESERISEFMQGVQQNADANRKMMRGILFDAALTGATIYAINRVSKAKARARR